MMRFQEWLISRSVADLAELLRWFLYLTIQKLIKILTDQLSRVGSIIIDLSNKPNRNSQTKFFKYTAFLRISSIICKSLLNVQGFDRYKFFFIRKMFCLYISKLTWSMVKGKLVKYGKLGNITKKVHLLFSKSRQYYFLFIIFPN